MSGSNAFDAAEMFAFVEAQAAMGPRRPGSPADRANEDYLEERLREFGLEDVRREPIPITHWAPQRASLELVLDGKREGVDAFPVAFSAFTPEEGIEAPLVWADPGRLLHWGSWRGAVVVTEIGFPALEIARLAPFAMGSYDPDGDMLDVKHPATWVRLGWHLYRKAVRRGAVGFVAIVRDQPGGTCRMFAPYGFRERDILDKPLPGFWVGKGDGDRLRRAAKGGSARARLTLTGVAEPVETQNIIGEVGGRGSDEVIVIHSHHDSPFASPVEDATGVAVVLSLARHFARTRELSRRLLVLFTAGHFYGSIGTREFLRRHRDDIVPRTVCEISVEHVAREAEEGPGGRLRPTGRPEITGVFIPLNRAVAGAVRECLAANDVRRTIILPAEGPLGDYPPTDGGDWYEAGVPVVNHICNPVYLLTDEDAPEWVDRDRLPRVAGAFADLVRRLDGMPREAIGAVDSRLHRLKLKVVKRIARARTTCFGLKPVY